MKDFSDRQKLTFRYADKLKPARAAVTKKDVEEYFTNLEQEVEGRFDN